MDSFVIRTPILMLIYATSSNQKQAFEIGKVFSHPTPRGDERNLVKGGIIMAVITISRQMESLGDQIAKAVAEKLSYNYVDKIKISDALMEQGLTASDFEKFDERKPHIWQSLSNQKKKLTCLLRATVYDFARSGNAVIVGQGGQALLKQIPGTLHVRIIAPLEIRIRRLMDQRDYDEQQARRLILSNDHESSGFISSFFNIDWDDKNMYDLLLNTRTMRVQAAVSLIISAITAQEFKQSSEEVEKNLEDKALAQKSKGVLVGIPYINLTSVEVAQGVVVLTGFARSIESINECKSIIAQIKGVKEVRSKLEIDPRYRYS